MIYNKHSELEGKHAFLGASKYTWLEWDDETLIERLKASYAAPIGTIVHDIAARMIRRKHYVTNAERAVLEWELEDKGVPTWLISVDDFFETFKMYVNDAISFDMEPEVVLKFSDNAFGTTDSVTYNPVSKFLRIHDLKTGSTPAHMEQLLIYAVLFCTENKIKFTDIRIELRIYQDGEIIFYNPTAEELTPISDRMVYCNKLISRALTKPEVQDGKNS